MPPADVHRLPGRQHPRVPFVDQIAVQIPDWEALRARCLDVSYGGVSLLLPQCIAVGDRLVFGLITPAGLPLQMQAVVRNVVAVAGDRFRVGLEWAKLLDDERSELRIFVDHVATKAA